MTFVFFFDFLLKDLGGKDRFLFVSIKEYGDWRVQTEGNKFITINEPSVFFWSTIPDPSIGCMADKIRWRGNQPILGRDFT